MFSFLFYRYRFHQLSYHFSSPPRSSAMQHDLPFQFGISAISIPQYLSHVLLCQISFWRHDVYVQLIFFRILSGDYNLSQENLFISMKSKCHFKDVFFYSKQLLMKKWKSLNWTIQNRIEWYAPLLDCFSRYDYPIDLSKVTGTFLPNIDRAQVRPLVRNSLSQNTCLKSYQ